MQVHKARLFGTDIVAVKELNDPTPAHEEQFRQEVAILSSLRSPYIVQFLGASLTQGSAMLLTEFCERGDLYQAIKRDQGTGMLSWHRRSGSAPDSTQSDILTLPWPFSAIIAVPPV